MFKLEAAISAWRRSLEHSNAFLEEDLDELERHVRDQVHALTTRGISEREAFERAIQDVGGRGAVEHEYRKVFWGKLIRQRRVGDEVRNRLSMLASYATVAYRNALRQKGYAALNLFGLAIGMACALLILLYVHDELSFDRFHEDADSIYRVNWDFDWNGRSGTGPGTPPPLAAALAQEFPEVEMATRIYPVSRMVVRNGGTYFSERRIVAADTTFLDMFDFQMLAGNRRTALDRPNSVVLTETSAKKFFGSSQVVGRDLLIGEERQVFGGRTYQPQFRVTGVIADPPPNSHLQFDMLTSIASHPEVAAFEWSWVWMQVTTYVKLGTGSSVEALHGKMPDMIRLRAADAFTRLDIDYDGILRGGGRWGFVFQPLENVYLGSADIGNRFGPVGNRSYVAAAATIAVFVLILACINYMNLATARSSARSREIGLRKVLGSDRRKLLGQFLIESLVFSFLAIVPALLLLALSIGPFNQLTGKSLHLDLLDPPWLPAAIIVLPLVVGVVAGSYPGFYLSSLRPVHILKGTYLPGRGSRRLRHGLVVFQFAVTFGLLACTLVVQRQLDFLSRADLGFDREHVVLIDNENDRLGGLEHVFKERLQRRPEVVSVSLSTNVPPNGGFQDSYNLEGSRESLGLISYLTDEELVPTLGIEIVEGRNFSKDHPTDTAGVILNEAAVRAFGLADPIGATVEYPGGDGRFHVIGVMRDFYFQTVRSPVTPFALFHRASMSYGPPDKYVVIRLAQGDPAAAIQRLESEWRAVAPAMPFEYSFLDENVEAAYQNDQRLGRIFGAFSTMAIAIACLGLLGLAAYSAEQRTKEIGIRRALGANVSSLVALLSKDFLKLVGFAFLVGAPAAYLYMRQWLNEFVYRIEIGAGLFIATGLLVLSMALLTVSYQAIRAALADPVESLRYE